MALSVTTPSGSSEQQNTTQSPQTAGQAANTGAVSSRVQPGTATGLLSGGISITGVPLKVTALSTVNIGNKRTQAQTQATSPVTTVHHVNPALVGMTFLFCLVAVVLFVAANRSEKITT